MQFGLKDNTRFEYLQIHPLELCYTLNHKDILEQNNSWVGTHTFVALKRRPYRNSKRTIFRKVSGSRCRRRQWVFMWYSCDLLAQTERHPGRQNKVWNHYPKELYCQFASVHTHGSGICPDMLLLIYYVLKLLLLWFNNNYGHRSWYTTQQLHLT